jgi:putative flippase GtrA
MLQGARGQFLRFCGVGAAGFFADAAVLYVLVHGFGLDPIPARVLSFSVAVVLTFELNRRWAFRAPGLTPGLKAFTTYLSVQGVGFACNFAIYTALLLSLPQPFNRPFDCLVVASAAALIVNYLGAHFVVFRRCAGAPVEHDAA